MKVYNNMFDFYLEFKNAEYRQIGKIFKPTNQLTEDECGDLIWLYKIIGDMIYNTIGYDNSTDCQDQLHIQINSDQADFTIESIKKFMTAIEKWAKTQPVIKADRESYHIQRGNKNYNDPDPNSTFGDGFIPNKIINLLVAKPLTL